MDFYSIARRLATSTLIRRLHEAGRGVHVWGIDGSDVMLAAIPDGADTLIVEDPALAIETIRWLTVLSASEQALLHLHSAFGQGEFLMHPSRWHAPMD